MKTYETCSIEMEALSFWLSRRYCVAIQRFLGHSIESVSSGTLSIAIIAMTSNKTTLMDNQSLTHDPEFNWDSQIKGVILGATSYGGICGLIGGYLALRYGGSTMITIGALMSSIMALLIPITARYNVYLLCLIKAIDGFGVQMMYSSCSELWCHWAPKQERSRLLSFAYSGTYIGTIVAYPLSGYVIQRFGWSAAFYFTGGLYFSWMVLWFLTVSNDPSNDKFISQKELRLIENNRERTKPAKCTTIFENMVKSKVILALCVVKFVWGAGSAIVVVCLPTFISDITSAEIDEIGIVTSIPNLVTLFAIPMIGYIADTLQNKQLMTTTQVHKLYVGIGCIGGSFFLFATACFSSILTYSIVCLTIFEILLSFSIAVAISNANYVAPNCASVVTGFSDIFYHFGALVSPMIVGFVVTNHNASEWSNSFCVFGAILLFSGMLLVIYGLSELQPWSYIDEDNIDCEQTVLDQNS